MMMLDSRIVASPSFRIGNRLIGHRAVNSAMVGASSSMRNSNGVSFS